MNQRKINWITLVLLVLGFGSALAIYLTAAHTPVHPLLDDPLANKKYLRELRMLGGQANVLAAEWEDWFVGLWQGESLARTVAVLTVGITLGFRFIAQRSGSTASPDPNEDLPPNP